MRFEIWFPVLTLVLGAVLVMGVRRIESRWSRAERREVWRERFRYEKLTELLDKTSRFHAIVDRHYWDCVRESDAGGPWPVGPYGEPLDPSDRSEYNQLWTDLQVLMSLLRDDDLREEIDELRDAASRTIEATSRDQGTMAYQRETEAYLAVAKRIGRMLSADLSTL